MSDVREQLVTLVTDAGWGTTGPKVVDAILERFDVTPKPVVTDVKLGHMVLKAACVSGIDADYVGQRMLDALAEVGLDIVRIEDES